MLIEGNAGWALRNQIYNSLSYNTHVYDPLIIPDIAYCIRSDENGGIVTLEKGPKEDPIKQHLIFSDKSLAITYGETLPFKCSVVGYERKAFSFHRYLFVYITEFEAKYVSSHPL